MNINEKQAEHILDLINSKENERSASNGDLLLAAEILGAFPAIDHFIKMILDEVDPFLIDGPNTDRITRLEAARRGL